MSHEREDRAQNTDKAEPQVGPAKPGDEPQNDPTVQDEREQGDERPRY